MTRLLSAVSIAFLITAPLSSQDQPDTRKPATGRWDLKIQATDGVLPSWLEVQKSGNTALVGRFVAVVGSARPISNIFFENDTLRFSIPPQWEQGGQDLSVEAAVAGDNLSGTITFPNGAKMPFTGARAPALHAGNVTWGKPVTVFNGKDLTGWHALPGGESAWQVVNGVLTNTKAGANLATNEKYADFKLHIEFRFPAKGNSGIYLRGRHELQIEDPVLGVVPIEGLGAIYGFIPPNASAGKKAGEWQTYDVTLVGRQVTVVLNGVEVICKRDIPGPTGGALDSDERERGPIFLQGDHGPIEYRKIVITPAYSR